MSFQGEIETTQSIPSQRIGTALQYYSGRFIHLHDLLDHWFKNRLIGSIVHAFLQGEIYRIVLALLRAQVGNRSSPGEEVAVLVEAARHYSVRAVKRLFDAVAVVDVDVDVQDSRMIFE